MGQENETETGQLWRRTVNPEPGAAVPCEDDLRFATRAQTFG